MSTSAKISPSPTPHHNKKGVSMELLQGVSKKRGAAYLVLIDPQKSTSERAGMISAIAERNGADAILVGGSGGTSRSRLDSVVRSAKKYGGGLPVIIFPGSAEQVSTRADAIMFMSLASSRNPKYLIGEQVRAAKRIWRSGLEVIPTGYLLVRAGSEKNRKKSSVEARTGARPIKGVKDVLAHALACKYLGFRALYLEAGSGSEKPIPEGIVRSVKEATGLPLFVGGGVRTPTQARLLARAGGDFIVTGNILEGKSPESVKTIIRGISRAVHYKDGGRLKK